ncbi:winged helix-turn-helix domain-containing protein [Colwellia psychrerythraea]|uniref:Transcriptional regulator, CadC n=1 Tax=Colwellia psychrerythraea TaxID=28229 RepID=A0A099K976_COLPS|nr:winged helix-turn-helix domain-containing protein [Colwellia psychrerythraea]KGJ86850.1 transcriptional regulator, CadC [Colwellia psychrerythraea]
MITKKSNQAFRFSEFEAIPQANLLIKRSQKKRLEPKVMSLLVLLASKNGDVVTRSEILATLWPNIVVGDEVISQLIYSLRNALVDDAKNPKYIETIPKKGYRFIAEVKVTNADFPAEKIPEKSAEKNTRIESSESSESSESLNNNSQVSSKNKWLISTCLVLISTFFYTWFVSNDNLAKSVTNLAIQNILPVTQDIGVEGDFSFHKDHNKMLYISSQLKRVDLYLKTLGNNQSEQMTNDDWIESSPLWLDKNTITYIRKKSGQFQIIRHVLTKEPEVVYESEHAIFHLTLKTNEPFSISFIEYDNYQHNKLHEVKSINLLNNKVSYLHESTLHLPSDILYQVYSLDGQTLYFFNNSDQVKEIISLDLKNNQYKTITNKFSWVEHIALLDSGNLLISGEVSATKGIWQLNINNQTIKSILPSSSGQRITRAKFKQNQIYYATYKSSTNQVIADIKQQSFDFLPKLNSDANEYYGVYSTDNKTMYFVSNRTGFYEVWSYNLNTQKTKQVTQLQASFIYKPVISNTKNRLAVVYKKEELTLSIISLTTGKPIKESTIPSMKYPLTWSKDDSHIYISEHIKQVNIYQYDSETLDAKLIQTNAGLFAKENSGETGLTLIDYKVNGLINKDINTGKITPLMQPIANLDYLVPGELKAFEHSILTVIKEGPSRHIQEYVMANGQQAASVKLLMELPDRSRVTDFNSDGTKAIFFKTDAPKGDIMTIQLSQ